MNWMIFVHSSNFQISKSIAEYWKVSDFVLVSFSLQSFSKTTKTCEVIRAEFEMWNALAIDVKHKA